MKKIWNPFIYLSGERCLGYGAAVLIITAIVAWAGDIVIRAPLSFSFGEMMLWRTTLHFVLAWAVWALLLWLWALLFTKGRFRAVDHFGMNLMARSLPLLPAVLCSLWISPLLDPLTPALEAGELPLQELTAVMMRPRMLLAGLLSFFSLVWFFIWSWKAYTLSTNLKGVKAAIGFILSYLLSELLVGRILLWL